MIGYAFCSSFCTLKKSLVTLEKFLEMGYKVLPIMTENVYSMDTKFGTASSFVESVEKLCGVSVIHTIVDAEPIGPNIELESLIIAPCTGNTLSKIANGITDTSVCMATKAHLRNSRPLIITLATNDALSANLQNIGTLLGRKNIYFVPMAQDDPIKKPYSLIADFTAIYDTMTLAISGKQIQPIFLPAGTVSL